MEDFEIYGVTGYTVMSNYHLRDSRLSLKAKGLLSIMLSLSKDWDYSINGLVNISKEGKYAITEALKELKAYDYVHIKQYRDEKGHFKGKFLVYYLPYSEWLKMKIKPDINYRVSDNPISENQTQLNINNKIDKIDKTSNDENIHNNLTIELLNKKYLTSKDYLDYYDNMFEELLENGYSYNQIYKSLHYIIPRVLSRNFIDDEGKIIENKYGYLKNALESNLNRFNKDVSELWNDLDDLIK